MSQHIIEATLAPECPAYVIFNHQTDAEEDLVEIDIVTVVPFGIVPPGDLIDLAYDWLHVGGGWDACRRLVEERLGGE